MRRVSLIIRNGPMEGTRRDLALGQTVIGRSPGPHGLLLSGDPSVSRLHGELLAEEDRVVFRNLSPHGSQVDGRPVDGSTTLEPGAVLGLGGYRVEVRFERSEAERRAAADTAGLWRSGPLARPAVRAALVVYLVALVALVTAAVHGSGADLDRAWERARSAYLESYATELPAAVRGDRLATAERLVGRLRALERSERWEEARNVCRRLMAIDGDPSSPIFRFAARRLGDLAGER